MVTHVNVQHFFFDKHKADDVDKRCRNAEIHEKTDVYDDKKRHKTKHQQQYHSVDRCGDFFDSLGIHVLTSFAG